MSLQERIIEEMGVRPEIDPAHEVRRSIDLMKNYLRGHPFLKTLVLGISGGQDSTLLGKLAQMAVDELKDETGDGSYQFIAVRLPYGEQFDEADARDVLDWISPDRTYTVNIQLSVDRLVDEVTRSGVRLSDFNIGNIKARERMIVQYALAGELAGVVLGSDHAAESVTGFYTKYGDGASDLNPLWRLNKRQGVQLLQCLDAPARFYEKIPTADLESDRPGRSDEEALGVSYEAIDDYLEGRSVSEADRQQIEKLYWHSRHKRHLPITVADTFWQEKQPKED